MKQLFILSLLFCALSSTSQKTYRTIEVDVQKKNDFSLSQIAKDIIIIALEKRAEFDVFEIHKVFHNNKNITILAGSEEHKGWPEWALQYDFEGNFLQQIGIEYDSSGQYLNVIDLYFCNERNELYTNNKNGYTVYDFNGNLKRKHKNTVSGKVINEKIYRTENSFDFEKGIVNYYLISTSLNSSPKDTIYKFIHSMPERDKKTRIAARPKISIANNKFYYIQHIDDKILSINNDNSTEPEYRFIFKNVLPDQYRMIVHPPRFVFNKYIYYGYRIKNRNFVYIYNMLTNSGCNLGLHLNEGKQVSGVYDDILNTGYIQLEPTNNNNMVFFHKSANEIKQTIAKNNAGQILFLVNIK